MGNVLDLSKQKQVIALGRLGWPLRRIEQETGVRRETASGYLRAAGIAVRGRGRPGEEKGKPAISAGVSTDPARPWPPPGPRKKVLPRPDFPDMAMNPGRLIKTSEGNDLIQASSLAGLKPSQPPDLLTPRDQSPTERCHVDVKDHLRLGAKSTHQ